MNRLFLIAALSLIMMGCGSKIVDRQEVAESNNLVYKRVTDTKVLKVAYLNYPPACMKNTKTGEMSGIFVDVLNKACDNLGLKLEWTEEVGWTSQIEGLNSNRYDIIGSPVWANEVRATKTTLSVPVYYSGIGVFVRSNDIRFDNDLSKINSPEVKVGTIDGETSSVIAEQDYPQAQKYSSTQQTDISQKFLDLASGKCDVVFTEPYYGYEYLKNNPGTIRNIRSENPIRLFGNCYMMKADEFQLKQMIDIAIQNLENSGYVDKIIQKYEPAPNLYYRVALPYKPIK